MKDFLLKAGYGGLEIEVDGNISFVNARILRDLGADIFVAGTSSIFPRNGIVSETEIEQMRKIIS